jgi:hypothetical protein
MSGRSCLPNLLETLESWTAALDSGSSVDAVYLDYQKAFDTVPHRRLFHKLQAYGVSGSVLQWISSFLSSRFMRVSVRGSSSSWVPVLSGVPQGSVLGPFLFLEYVNDILERVQWKLFADDTKVWEWIRSLADCARIQSDLDSLVAWYRDWLLRFHVGKCKAMHIGHKNPNHVYTMDQEGVSTNLETIEKEKDLGVWTSNTLKPSQQCVQTAAKATSVLRSVKNSFTCFNKKASVLFTKLRETPLLVLWAGLVPLLQDIQYLERVPHRATKMVRGLGQKPYSTRLQALGLYSLEQRRLRGDLFETYKLLHGKENIDSQQFFFSWPTSPAEEVIAWNCTNSNVA